MAEYTAEQVAMVADYLHNTYGDMEAVDLLRAYAATLRQQAGRVDEVTDAMVSRAVIAAGDYEVAHKRRRMTINESQVFWKGQMRAALTAALAQNTQGDGEAVAWVTPAGNVYGSQIMAEHECDPGQKPSPLYLHAERARVPDALRHAAKVIEFYDDALGGSCEMATSTDCAEVLVALADYYAAAPSQPKDAGEVES